MLLVACDSSSGPSEDAACCMQFFIGHQDQKSPRCCLLALAAIGLNINRTSTQTRPPEARLDELQMAGNYQPCKPVLLHGKHQKPTWHEAETHLKNLFRKATCLQAQIFFGRLLPWGGVGWGLAGPDHECEDGDLLTSSLTAATRIDAPSAASLDTFDSELEHHEPCWPACHDHSSLADLSLWVGLVYQLDSECSVQCTENNGAVSLVQLCWEKNGCCI